MWLHAVLRDLKSRILARARRTRLGAIDRRLALEALEERYLLSFDPALNYAVASNPQDLVVADFNGDSMLDFATISSSALSVAVGNPGGGFQPAQYTSVGPGLVGSIAAGDLNDDGTLDLAATASVWRCTEYGYTWGYYGSYWGCINSVTEGYARVLLGNGDGTFQSSHDFLIDSTPNPASVVLGDVNGDEWLDVVAGSSGNSVSVLLGNGDGTLQYAQYTMVGYAPRSVAIGHLDSDGNLDLVTANQGSQNVSALLGNGDGTFQPARHTGIGQNTHAVVLGDIDSDGKLDLAATSSVTTCTSYGWYGCYASVTDGHVNVLLGNGDGSFASAQTTWANNAVPLDVAVGDFNADGNLDFATADQLQQGYDPTVLLGKGDGTFDLPYSFDSAAGPVALAVADFNGDAEPDLAVANSYASSVSLLMNDANWPPFGAPSVSISDASVVESNSGTTAATFTISLSGAFEQIVSVTYRTEDGTALDASDYEAVSALVDFEPGETSRVISILVNGDRVGEADESFLVKLIDPSNARMGDGLALGMIVDDEPRVTISDVTVVEGNTGTTVAEFMVTLSDVSEVAVTVNFTTAAGTAAGDSDFEEQNGTLSFKPGETQKLINVLVAGERVFEQTQQVVGDDYWGYYTLVHDHESFFVNLSESEHAVIADAQGLGTIFDDEPRISIGDSGSITEGNAGTKAVPITVSVATAYDADVTVAYSTSDGTATAGNDFQDSSGTVTIPAGKLSATFDVVVNGDRIAEGGGYSGYEDFFINLANPNHGGLVDSQSWAVITDDEPRLSINYVSLKESNGGTKRFVFTVTLSTPTGTAYDQAVTVKFATKNDTATAGEDYVATSGTLTFAPGQTTKIITVLVKGDSKKEWDEYFSVVLSSASSNAIISNADGWGTILNDDGRNKRWAD